MVTTPGCHWHPRQDANQWHPESYCRHCCTTSDAMLWHPELSVSMMMTPGMKSSASSHHLWWCDNAKLQHPELCINYFIKKLQVYDNDDNSGMSLALSQHLQWHNDAKLQHLELSEFFFNFKCTTMMTTPRMMSLASSNHLQQHDNAKLQVLYSPDYFKFFSSVRQWWRLPVASSHHGIRSRVSPDYFKIKIKNNLPVATQHPHPF